MLSRWSRYLIPSLTLALVGISTNRGVVVACELCRLTGTTAHHVSPIGGDDLDDTLIAPSAQTNEDSGGATAQFLVGGGKWPQPGGPGSPVTVTYSYENMFNGGLRMPSGQSLPNDLIRRSIEEAFSLWASVAPLHFVEVPDNGRPYGDPMSTFGQIRFRHVYINGPDIPGQAPMAKARAYFPASGGQYAGDVEFDHGDPWQQVGTLTSPDILGAAAHEIGHTLGLQHTNLPFNYLDNNQAVMFWVFRRFAGPGTGELHADDIAGVRAVYGAGIGSVTPLAIPEPATSTLMTVALTAVWLGSSLRRAPSRMRR